MTSRALRISGLVAMAVLCVAPLSASADTCPVIGRTLSIGVRGDDVRQLQRFLMNEGELLSDYLTGYFGPLTQAAVGSWQRVRGIVTSDEAGSGWGVVGPRTRAAITATCGGSVPSAPSTGNPPSTATTSSNAIAQCRIVLQPAISCATAWQGLRGSNGCVSSWYCAVPARAATSTTTVPPTSTTTRVSATNAPPVITNFSGPDTLRIGETGTWTVTASDPEGQPLSYSFAWGSGSGGGSAFDQILQAAQAYASSRSGTHAYTVAGGYRVSVTVHDSADNTVETARTVTVSSAGGSISTSTATSTTGGTGTTTPNTLPYTYWCSSGVGTLGYWSQTPCYSGVAQPWATSSNPFGSSSGTAVEGAICAPEGRQEFIACPNMSDCMGGGTYLQCRSGIWRRM